MERPHRSRESGERKVLLQREVDCCRRWSVRGPKRNVVVHVVSPEKLRSALDSTTHQTHPHQTAISMQVHIRHEAHLQKLSMRVASHCEPCGDYRCADVIVVPSLSLRSFPLLTVLPVRNSPSSIGGACGSGASIGVKEVRNASGGQPSREQQLAENSRRITELKSERAGDEGKTTGRPHFLHIKTILFSCPTGCATRLEACVRRLLDSSQARNGKEEMCCLDEDEDDDD